MTRSFVIPPWCHAVVVAVVVLAAYGGDVGRGFIKEDATWIMRSRVDTPSDLVRLCTETGGFFRPMVGLSFAMNHWMFGGHPAGYGWTNLLLALAIAAALFRFARALGVMHGAAILAAAVWILNFHGINMAVLWLSGRTALLLVLFAVLAGTAAARHQAMTTAAFTLLAMASKEEGVLLPIAMIAVAWLRPQGRPDRKRLFALIGALVLVWAVYSGIRMSSDAYTPVSAPAFYTFVFNPTHVWRNILEYADRALTLPVAVTALAFVIARRLPNLQDNAARKLVLMGGVWLVCGFALTVLLPARSSLYALLPSVGAVIAAAGVLDASWRSIPQRRQRTLVLIATVLPLILVPVYWQRNARWTELADVSAQTVAAFAELAPSAPEPWRAIVLDDPSTRSNVASALGWGLPDTVELVTQRRPHVWIAPPPLNIDAREVVMLPASVDVVFGLRNGRVVRLPSERVTPAPAAELW